MEEITIKKGPGRPKGSTKKVAKVKEKFKKSAAKKKVAKKKPSKTKDELIDQLEESQDLGDKDLEALTKEELTEEALRATIKQRNAAARKQERLNAVASSSLVEKDMVVKKISSICQKFVERLNNTPDKLTPQLHKRSKSEIREKMVKEFDFLKQDFIEFINEGL